MNNSIGQILRDTRVDLRIKLSDVQGQTGLEDTLISKIENGVKMPTYDQLRKLSTAYGLNPEELLSTYRINDVTIRRRDYPRLLTPVFNGTSEELRYGVRYLPLLQDYIYPKPLGIENRRYIGSKAKLTEWIMDTIKSETTGVKSFCDLFGGTGVVTSSALQKFDNVIVNDFLYTNQIIYTAFFAQGKWDQEKIQRIINSWNMLDAEGLKDNYFSENFGGKFFGKKTSKIIGHIRQQIEDARYDLSTKEYAILLSTLIYNIDRLSNTVGHFDAYIKKPITETKPFFRIIDAKEYEGVEIYREDANQLANEVEADLFYLDPPYNSRQYSRFYHVYETLVKWDAPKLYGVALKPAPENMSRFCTVKAADAFRDLVSKMKTQYIVVSYNNTYHSKSKSSENKISLEEIERILSLAGETKVFEHTHQAFNTGKTDFKDHKELLFITTVDDDRRSKAFSPLLRR